MKQANTRYHGWKAKSGKGNPPISFFIFVPAVNAQWEYDLKMAKQGARQDGLRVKTFKRTIKAGGAEIQAVVLVLYEAPVEATT